MTTTAGGHRKLPKRGQQLGNALRVIPEGAGFVKLGFLGFGRVLGSAE